MQGIARGVIIGLGILVFLGSVGISITPLIASLGIGTLAVALALQDALANLFAGLYMFAEKPIAAGHFWHLSAAWMITKKLAASLFIERRVHQLPNLQPPCKYGRAQLKIGSRMTAGTAARYSPLRVCARLF